MTDVKKFLMIGGGLAFVFWGTYLVAMDALGTASFILYGNRWIVPLMTATIILLVTAILGFTSVWWAQKIENHLLDIFFIKDYTSDDEDDKE